MPLSVRLDPRTERLISRLARTSRRTKSQVVREAIARMAEAEYHAGPAATAFEKFKDAIGIGKGGPPDLSERTGDKVRALLGRRRRP